MLIAIEIMNVCIQASHPSGSQPVADFFDCANSLVIIFPVVSAFPLIALMLGRAALFLH